MQNNHLSDLSLSYLSLEEAQTYFERQKEKRWLDLNEETKELLIFAATRWIFQNFFFKKVFLEEGRRQDPSFLQAVKYSICQVVLFIHEKKEFSQVSSKLSIKSLSLGGFSIFLDTEVEKMRTLSEENQKKRELKRIFSPFLESENCKKLRRF